MSRIFISYIRVDKEKVFKIKEQIESALGEKCWIDFDGRESDAYYFQHNYNYVTPSISLYRYPYRLAL